MKKILVFMLLTLLTSISVKAKYLECTTCSSETSFYNKAKQNVDLIEGRSYISVGNTITGSIRKYIVIYQPGNINAGERPMLKVGTTSVDSNTQSLFNDAVYYRRQIIDFIDGSVSVPDNVALSAWQLSGNSVFQRDIAIYYNDNQTFTESIGNYVSVILALGGKIVGANILVAVKFSDGSFANFKITGINYKGDVVFEFFNAVDSLGNPIPNSAAELSGQYRMTSENMSAYRNTVNRFRFTLKAPTISQGSVTITDCYLNVTTKEVTCESKPDGVNLPWMMR